MRNKTYPKGETLAETIIALSVLAIGITVASTVILNSMRNMTNAKNRLIAINIAREGIEAVRNIRDTNWLLYSDRRRQCWNHDSNIAPCTGATPIIPGTYVIYKYEDGSWRLILADTDTNNDSDNDGVIDNDLDLANISFVDIDDTLDSDGDSNLINDTDMYNHTDAPLVAMGTPVRTTGFRRYVRIEYLENKPDPLSVPSNIHSPEDSINDLTEWTDGLLDTTKLNRMRVTSVIEWKRQNATHKVELKTILTDHLGRLELES